MRRRIGSALALWALIGLGHAGCATQSKRAEAPIQFRQWKDPSTPSTASTKASASSPAPSPAPAQAQPPDLISSLLGRTALASASASSSAPAPGSGTTAKDRAVASEIPASSVRPRYRPGSWLFRRFNKPAAAPATAPPGDPSGSLARFFPTLYGKTPADPTRLAQTSRPQAAGLGAGRMLGLSGASVEMTQNTMAPPSGEPPLLADGIPVRAYPKAPSPSLPPSEALASRDEPIREPEPRPGPEPAAPGEHLTSHEETESLDSLAPRKRDLIDALSTHLEASPPRSEVKPSPKPDPDDAPSDPAGRATSATVEVPRPRPVAATEAERPGVTPLLNVELGSSPAAAKTAATSPATASGGQPRTPLTVSVELPEPEFPATYHTESLRQVTRETPRLVASPRPISIEPAPRPPLLPRLSRLLWGPATEERSSAR